MTLVQTSRDIQNLKIEMIYERCVREGDEITIIVLVEETYLEREVDLKPVFLLASAMLQSPANLDMISHFAYSPRKPILTKLW